MAARKSLHTDPCPVARGADLIADRWSLLIVRDAFDGLHRFSEFQRNLGVARNILADRLRRLVDAGILRTQAPEGNAHQAYVLTPKGEALFPVVVALRQWSESHLYAKGEPKSRLLDARTGRRVPPMAPLAEDGTPLAASSTVVRKVA